MLLYGEATFNDKLPDSVSSKYLSEINFLLERPIDLFFPDVHLMGLFLSIINRLAIHHSVRSYSWKTASQF